MFDRRALGLLRPALHALARQLAARGVSANTLTFAGLALGLCAAVAIAVQQPLWGLALLLMGRLCDGLDGTLARLTHSTDRGAYFDIVCDMLFYASVPLAFALANPPANALAAAVLLAAFIGTSASFLAFAVMAERRGLPNLQHPNKGLFYLGGLTEGFETIVCFALMCLWPAHFAALALGFAALCGITLFTRLFTAWSVLR
jgi:phosphatidylglycerophosphate synthase